MTREELNTIKEQLSQILDDIAGNPDWYDAASALASDIGTLEKNLEKMVVVSPFGLVDSPKLKGWVARDEDGRLTLFNVEPRRLDNGRWWDRDYPSVVIDEQESFPDLKWEDGPIEVELIIHRV